MARNILAFFGGFSILIGILIIVAGALTYNGLGVTMSLVWGSCFLIAGAPLLGFARVIDLLEQIARNTKPSSRTVLVETEHGYNADPLVTQFMKDRVSGVIRERAARQEPTP